MLDSSSWSRVRFFSGNRTEGAAVTSAYAECDVAWFHDGIRDALGQSEIAHLAVLELWGVESTLSMRVLNSYVECR
jgi:hypothetical protein